MNNNFTSQSFRTNFVHKRYRCHLFKLVWFALLILSAGVGCQSQSDGSNSSFGQKANGSRGQAAGAVQYGYQKLTVEPVSEIAKNPLKRAMELVGASPDREYLPHSSEAGYNLICTLPIVDAIQQAPLQMPVWARSRATDLQHSAQNGLAPLLTDLMKTLDPGYAADDGIVLKEDDPAVSLVDILEESFQGHGDRFPAEQIENINAIGLSPQFDAVLGSLVRSLIAASDDVEEAIGDLNADERRLLRMEPERYFFRNGDFFKFLTADTHSQVEMVQMAQKVDFPKLFKAALYLGQAVDRFVFDTERLKSSGTFGRLFLDGSVPNGEILAVPTPAGNLVLLGADDNRFVGDAALLIDLGGDDHYRSVSTNQTRLSENVRISIDFGGNDYYEARQHKQSQGSGSLSIGLMIDRNGDDEYQAGDMAQGAAFFGVGLLMDQEGNDIYQMGLMGQGFGLFGFGALADMDGNDRYVIKGMGQGAGATLGMGALLDSKGDDKYLAGGGKSRSALIPDSMTHCQGAGLSIRSHTWVDNLSIYGGIGILSDGSGNDLYHATGGNCMGSSYFMSLGALVDHAGNDIYIPEGGYGIGFGLHLSDGVLLDIKGDDVYIAGSFCGGFGSDRSVGILVDRDGNDIYGPSDRYINDLLKKVGVDSGNAKASQAPDTKIMEKMADTSYGAALKPKAFGLLVDFKGEDQYFANSFGKGESIGGVIPPVDPEDWSHGVAVDLSGHDQYNLYGKKDDHYAIYYGHGVCYDVNSRVALSIEDIFPAFHYSDNPKSEKSLESVPTDQPAALVAYMANCDLWHRFRAKGILLRMGSEATSACLDSLRRSSNEVLNGELFEILSQNLINRRIGPFDNKLADLLLAKSEKVQLRTVYLLGWQKWAATNDRLIAICDQSSLPLKPAALWAIGRIGQMNSIDPVISNTDQRQHNGIRRAAYGSLAALVQKGNPEFKFREKDVIDTLLRGLGDKDPVIKIRSIRGLGVFYGQPQISKKILRLLKDPNVYVRRQAARIAAFNGNSSAIPVLIESLRFRSIDTFKHYDHEIAKDLSFLCGVDFADEKRYDYQTWQRWWQQNSHLVNLDRNLKIMGRINEAFNEADLKKGLAIFGNLLSTYPKNTVVRKRYSRFCHEWITYRLLNQKVVTIHTLEKAIKLQKILISLDPENELLRRQLNYLEERFDDVREKQSTNLKTAS